MSERIMVERIIDFEDPNNALQFEQIDQRIATLTVEDKSEWTTERLVDAAYSEANMRPKERDEHRITVLGKSVEVEL